MSVSITSRNPFHRNSTRTVAHQSSPSSTSEAAPRTSSRKTFTPSTRKRSERVDNTAIFMVPVYDDRHQGADLLIISPLKLSHQERSDTPGRAPTPPPKPVIPRQCEDWDDFISWRKSEAMCKAEKPEKPEKPRLVNSAKEDIMRGFEEWKDYLSQMRIPGRRARPVSIMSTSTTGRSLARSSMCSVSSTGSSKARSLRRSSRSRHLRAYYSMGSLLRNKFSPRDNEPVISPIADILRNSASRHQSSMRRPMSQQSLPANWTYLSSPPPHPPPNKPLPALPAEAGQGERKTRKRNRSVLEMRERKRFQFLLWQ